MKQLHALQLFCCLVSLTFVEIQPNLVTRNQTLNIEQLVQDGDSALQLNNLSLATFYYRQAVGMQQENIDLLNKLAFCYFKQNDFASCAQIFKKIASINPTAYVYKTLGILNSQLMHIDQAIDAFNQSLKLDPLQKEVIGSVGQAYQIKGDLEIGWKYWRLYDLLAQEQQLPNMQPWKGQSLLGKTIIIIDEGGAGDLMEWIRYAALFKKSGARVIWEVRASMVPLLSRCHNIDQIVVQGNTLPAADFYIQLGRIHRTFNTTIDTIPAQIPYLFADPQLTGYWKDQLAANKRFKIGICWRGQNLSEKCMPLAEFMPLADFDQISLYSLQQTDEFGEISQFPAHKLSTFYGDFDQSNGAFSDTAAVIKNLDLIITVDTSIAHLAGGLGVPLWILLPFTCNWRWFLTRTDCPWYPTARLFRQPRAGDWKTPIQEMVKMLNHAFNK